MIETLIHDFANHLAALAVLLAALFFAVAAAAVEYGRHQELREMERGRRAAAARKDAAK